MANVRLAVPANQAAMKAITDLLDASSPTPGYVEIMTGPQVATGNTAITTEVVLARLTFTDPAAGAPSVNGRVDFNAIADDTLANATGTAVWARWYDGVGTAVFDCDVSTSGATLNLNTTSITSGGVVSVVSFWLEHPDGT